MTAVERDYNCDASFILSGVLDTLDVMGGADTEIVKRYKAAESRLVIYGKENRYRFTVRPLPFGCTLQIRSLNTSMRLTSDTEHRLIGVIFGVLEQLIKDALEKGNG